jgi:diadenylate cyclase
LKKSNKKLIDGLKRISPGTTIRDGIENIVKAKMGSLLILADIKKIRKIFSGGFRVNCKTTPAKLYELSKMDGALILNQNGTKIVYANTYLFPDPKISTKETGIMHQTAERVAKQVEGMVIAISKNRNMVTIYLDDLKYNLKDIRLVLDEANRALETLERYRDDFKEQLNKLNLLEIDEAMTLFDVVSVWQTAEMAKMVASEIERYLYELGTEGILVSIQLSQIMDEIDNELFYLIRDYVYDEDRFEDAIKKESNLSYDKPVNLNKLAEILGFSPPYTYLDKIVNPRGFRILYSVAKLPKHLVENVIESFKSLKVIKKLGIDELSKAEGIGKVRARTIINSIKRISEQI